MVGFGVRIFQDPLRLIVTSPANIWLLLTVALFTIWPLLIKLNTKPFPKRGVIIWSLLILIANAFLLNSAQVTLDRSSQTATIREFYFYHWSTKTMPLSDLDHAYLNTGATSSRIVLQFADGHVMSLSANTQMSGKEKAVYAINAFLARNAQR